MHIDIKELARRAGMDKSIAYSSGARVVQGITGVVSVLFITSFLTKIEQGFYFTFGSILALQIFFELGLTGIMTQYVAHEASHLVCRNEEYEGEARYKSRLASLLRFCIKWYAAISVVVLIFLLLVGWMFFSRYGADHAEVRWQIPWVLICLGTSLKLFQAPLNSILMGLGFVKEMSKASFYQQLILPIFTWIGLACGFKLYVMGVGYLLTVVYWQVFVQKSGLFKILTNLMKVELTERVGYFKEIFPYQWRIALSWVSGYFIFQLFNPVLFATEGAVVAGQMGMTLQAISAISSFSMSWQNTKIPLYSKLIALKNFTQLDSLFNKTTKQMSRVCLMMLTAFILFLFLLRTTEIRINNTLFADRFLDYIPLLFMLIPTYINQFTSSWATYLRCHKQEPYLANSLCAGVLCMTTTVVGAKMFGVLGVTIGYFIVQLSMLPWSYTIFKNKKKEWHIISTQS